MSYMKALNKDDLPIVIVHWTTIEMGWPNTRPSELRKFLEPRIRSQLFPDDVVDLWVSQAREWEHLFPELAEEKMRDYEGARLLVVA